MKRVVVFGASSPTGHQILHRALAAGHAVTGAVRDPRSLAPFGDRVRIARFSLDDPAAVSAAIAGHDAVVSTLGAGGMRSTARPTDVYSRSARLILDGMLEHGTKRLIAVTSGGVEHDDAAPWPYRLFFRRYMMNGYMDMMKLETIVEHAPPSIEWTLVRPTLLVNGPPRHTYLVWDRRLGEGQFRIRRSDVAGFIVDELEKGEWIRRHPVLAYAG